jgi:hypothetical protein
MKMPFHLTPAAASSETVYSRPYPTTIIIIKKMSLNFNPCTHISHFSSFFLVHVFQIPTTAPHPPLI